MTFCGILNAVRKLSYNESPRYFVKKQENFRFNLISKLIDVDSQPISTATRSHRQLHKQIQPPRDRDISFKLQYKHKINTSISTYVLLIDIYIQLQNHWKNSTSVWAWIKFLFIPFFCSNSPAN